MSAMISVTSMVVILSLIVYMLTRKELRESEERGAGTPPRSATMAGTG